MNRVDISFSKEQLEYIKGKYSIILSTDITPKDTINTIMYNAGVEAVINSIAERTHGVLPLRPR